MSRNNDKSLVNLSTVIEGETEEVSAIDPESRFSEIRKIAQSKQTWIPIPGDVIINTNTGAEFLVKSASKMEFTAKGIILFGEGNPLLNEVITIPMSELYGESNTYSLVGNLDFNSNVRGIPSSDVEKLKKNFRANKIANINKKIMENKEGIVVNRLASLPLTVDSPKTPSPAPKPPTRATKYAPSTKPKSRSAGRTDSSPKREGNTTIVRGNKNFTPKGKVDSEEE